MAKKLQSTHEDVYKKIFSIGGVLNLRPIKSDYECASINCFKKNYKVFYFWGQFLAQCI